MQERKYELWTVSWILELALETLELKKAALDAEIETLRAQLGGNIQIAAAGVPTPRGSKGKSAAEREAVSLRMKAYWQARRDKAASPASAQKPATINAKPELSAANMARAAKMKAYWAKRRRF
jgi:hypothetical protein